MFNRISTENLRIAEIRTLESIFTFERDGRKYISREYSGNSRYTLVKDLLPGDTNNRIDIFTGTYFEMASSSFTEGAEVIKREYALITDKKYITKEEALYILEEKNPTYLKEKPKVLKKKR